MNDRIVRKIINPDHWKKYVRRGDRVFIGSGAACPSTLVSSLLTNAQDLVDLEFTHILTLGETPWIDPIYKDRFTVNSLFLGTRSRGAVSEGYGDYTPCFLSEIPALFKEGILPIDVALIAVSPPDDQGYCSFGVSVDVVSAACESAKRIVAQINSNMPRTFGQSFIHVDQLDAVMLCDEPLPEHRPGDLDDVTLRIGEYVSMLVDDGDTLQMGIGKIPDAVLQHLKNHNDLGIHTEMFSDGILQLCECGNITNSRKTIHRNKTITSFCIGTKQLYDYVDRNPHVEFHPSDYVNSPVTIARNHKMVAINSAIEVDLTGQVVSDSVGYRFYSGIGGQVDFIRGAAMCPQGKPIIALPSTAKGGTLSKIVPYISEGSGVVTSRGDVHYVVTEYGIATLRGRTIRERALELIQVAHPKFRDMLLEKVREHFWVPPYQKHKPQTLPEFGGLEAKIYRLKDGNRYYLRPLHPSDQRRLQEFFYSHKLESVYQRYRSNVSTMSQSRAYELVNIDQTRDLALTFIERQGPREVIHAVGRFFVNQDGKSAELAFIVKEEKQGLGMASRLMEQSIDIARKRGIQKLEGYVREENIPMCHVFEKFGFEKIRSETSAEVLFHLNVKQDENILTGS